MKIQLPSLALALLVAACGVSVEQSSPSSDLSVSEADSQPVETATESVATDLDFELTDTEGKTHKLSSYLADGKTVVLEWFNPGCPVVRKYHDGAAMKGYATAALADDDVVWLAVNSGAVGNQGHGLEANQEARVKWGLDYPVLLDESGEVGRMFGAQTTPHMFVITPQDGIVYQGGIDESDNRGPPMDTSMVTRALAELAEGKPVSAPEVKPFGCSVKYAR